MTSKAKNPIEEYSSRIEQLKNSLSELQKKSSKMSMIRLSVFLITFTAVFAGFYFELAICIVLSITVFFLSFIPLVLYHDKIKEKIEYSRHLLSINENSILRIKGKWTSFADVGEEFIDTGHPFTSDLDIVGMGSLYQYINTALTFFGRRFLYMALSTQEKNRKTILQRQEAIKELSLEITWRQKYQAITMMSEKISNDPGDLLQWFENKELLISTKWKKFLIRAFPLITSISIILGITTSHIHNGLPLAMLLIQLCLTLYMSKSLHEIFSMAGKYKDMIKSYSKMIRHIEDKKFNSDILADLAAKLQTQQWGKKASKCIKRLESIIGFINLRYSSIHFPINILTLWDMQFLISLEKWKCNAGIHLREWLNILADFEELSSFAIIPCDNRDWAFAEISDDDYKLTTEEAGHPLIHESTRVNNSLSLDASGSIVLITGSNMSGKSTMLRTIGVNLVLSYAGAPACAKQFHCSIMDLYTSMRVNDNLEKNISSFYAELIRVKMIIEAAKSRRPMIFFLDEIFRGTNSRDRKAGAVTVLKTLSADGVMGLVSTHDVELADLQDDAELDLKNYFFRETYKDNTICFDYIMREGISDTSDAIYLMRIIGIDI